MKRVFVIFVFLLLTVSGLSGQVKRIGGQVVPNYPTDTLAFPVIRANGKNVDSLANANKNTANTRADSIKTAVNSHIPRLDTRADSLKNAVNNQVVRIDTRADSIKAAMNNHVPRLDMRADSIKTVMSTHIPRLDARADSIKNGLDTIRGYIFDVRSAGATGGGIVDDGWAIKLAISAGHKRIYLPAGTYYISDDQIAITQNVFNLRAKGLEFFGDGMGKTIIKLPSIIHLPGNRELIHLGDTAISVHDFTVICADSITENADFTCINVDYPRGHIFNIEITNLHGRPPAGAGGIGMYNTYNIEDGNLNTLVENCYIHDCTKATAIGVNSCGNVIRSNKISNIGNLTTMHGMYVQGGNNIITDNYISGISGYAIHGHKAVQGIDGSGDRYSRNTIVNCRYGVICDGLISDGSNVKIPNGAPLTRFVTISENVFQYNGAVDISSYCPSIITGNITDGNYGANFLTSSGGSIISNNLIRQFYPTATADYLINIGANDVFSNNNILNISAASVVIRANDSAIVKGNNILMNGASTAISFSARGVRIEDNIIRSYKDSPLLYFGSADSFYVKNNYFYASGNYKICEVNFSTRCGTIENNDIPNGYLRFDGVSPNVILRTNHIPGGISNAGNTRIKILKETRELFYGIQNMSIPEGLLIKYNATHDSVTEVAKTDSVFIGITVSRVDNPNRIYYAGGVGITVDGVWTDGPWTVGNVGIISSSDQALIHDTGSNLPPKYGWSYIVFLNSGTSGVAKVYLAKTL